jgi:hypothetical protein
MLLAVINSQATEADRFLLVFSFRDAAKPIGKQLHS